MENCNHEEGQESRLGIYGFWEGNPWELAWLQQAECFDE